MVDSEYRLGRCFREIQFTRTPLKEDFSTRAKRRKLLKEVKFSLVSGKLSNYVLMKRICIYACYMHMLLIVGGNDNETTNDNDNETTNDKRQMTNDKQQMTICRALASTATVLCALFQSKRWRLMT